MKKVILGLMVFSFCLICLISFTGFSAQAAPITLKVSSWVPPMHVFHRDIMVPWGKKIEKLTNGKVVFKQFPGGALGKHQDQFGITTRGITDIALIMQSITPNRFPMTSVMRLPFLTVNSERASTSMWKLYEKYMKDEYKDIKVLALVTAPGGQFHTAKKWVKTLDDLKGMKIRAHGLIVSQDLKALGATPLTMPLPDIYTSVERGTIDGMAVPWEIMRPMKFYEVTPYHTELSLYSPTFVIGMNKKKFDSLPPDVQKVINENSGAKFSTEAGKLWDKDDAAGRAVCVKNGAKIHVLEGQELEKWKKTVQPVVDQWIKDKTAMGFPAKQILDDAIKWR
ncbi:TRAP transporter substrate-binding protein [Thermodesulfobacteriota bacterium]